MNWESSLDLLDCNRRLDCMMGTWRRLGTLRHVVSHSRVTFRVIDHLLETRPRCRLGKIRCQNLRQLVRRLRRESLHRPLVTRLRLRRKMVLRLFHRSMGFWMVTWRRMMVMTFPYPQNRERVCWFGFPYQACISQNPIPGRSILFLLWRVVLT